MKRQIKSMKFKSNFDYERIQKHFQICHLYIRLFELKNNYNILNLSTTEIILQLQKIFSYPIYLCLMTLLASIIMFYLKKNQNSTLKISFGLFLSVVIYYLNNFLYVLGKTEKINIILSVWAPLIILMIINSMYILKINEK